MMAMLRHRGDRAMLHPDSLQLPVSDPSAGDHAEDQAGQLLEHPGGRGPEDRSCQEHQLQSTGVLHRQGQ